MQQQPRALEVLQEPDPEPYPCRRSLDQPRYVGHDEAAIHAYVDHAELRVQRRERIIGDFWPRGRYRARQRRLARIRRAEQPHVGQQLQRETELALLAGLAGIGLPRRTIHARLEARIAAPALAAFRHQQPVAVVGQIAEHLAGVEVRDDGALGHLDDQVGARRARHVLARPAAPAFGAEPPLHAKVGQRVDAFARDEIDAAAVTAVAAVRAAARDELLATKADAAAPARAGFDTDIRFVNEFHGLRVSRTKKPRGAGLLHWLDSLRR